MTPGYRVFVDQDLHGDRGATRLSHVNPMRERVAQHRDEIKALVEAHHATAPRVFGSTARGEGHAWSDLDVLVEFTDEATLLDEVGLRLALRDLLRVEVDVVALDALRGSIRERVLREAWPV